MDATAMSQRIHAQISALRSARDSAGASADQRAAADDAMLRLEGVLAAGAAADADELAGRVNVALADLEAIRARHNLDGISCLGVTIRALRALDPRIG